MRAFPFVALLLLATVTVPAAGADPVEVRECEDNGVRVTVLGFSNCTSNPRLSLYEEEKCSDGSYAFKVLGVPVRECYE